MFFQMCRFQHSGQAQEQTRRHDLVKETKETNPKEMKVHKLLDKEFKVTIVKMLASAGK